MTLAELMARYEERARVAKVHQSTAPVSAIYRVILDDLSAIDGFEMAGRWMTSGEASKILGVSPKTIRKWCNAGRFPSACKTSGDEGEWRIPTHEVYADGRREKAAPTPRLWRPDE